MLGHQSDVDSVESLEEGASIFAPPIAPVANPGAAQQETAQAPDNTNIPSMSEEHEAEKLKAKTKLETDIIAATSVQEVMKAHSARRSPKGRRPFGRNFRRDMDDLLAAHGSGPATSDFMDKMESIAALHIQKHWRGHITRTNLCRKKRIESRYSEDTAAVNIQRSWRGHHARAERRSRKRRLDEQKRRQSSAAIRIQQSYRGHAARRRRKIARREEARKRAMEESAICLQSCWRGYHSRKNRRRLSKAFSGEEVENPTLIAATKRGDIQTMKEAIILGANVNAQNVSTALSIA